MIEFVIEYGFGYGKPTPGHSWKASFYDRDSQIRASASGFSVWDAIAWALVAWQEAQRKVVVIASNVGDTPEAALARLPQLPASKLSPTGDGSPDRSSSCEDRNDSPSVAFASAPTFTLEAPHASAAARRARTRKTARK